METFHEVRKELDFPELEHRILTFWNDYGIPDQYRRRNRGKKRWSFQDGPITANNPMGVHHAWGRAYKDIFQRYRTMKGYDQRYQNGFDCQGLWVEVDVEKELGFNSKKDIEQYGIDAFVEKCQERAHKYSMVQTAQSIRLGMWMDWGEWKTDLSDPEWLKKSHSYYTLSDPNNYTIWHFLKKCHERGLVYKGVDVMPWCSRCGTAISDMEIATEGYKEMSHKAVFVRFPIHQRPGEYLLVWTTTPWTLTANAGCAVNPDLAYVKVRNGAEVYYLAKNLIKVLRGDHTVLAEMPGKNLVGWTYDGPFDGLPAQQGVVHKVIPWEEVSEAEGTGIVHIAPGCGKEDFALGREHGLKVIAPLDESGVYRDGFGWLSGANVKDVARPIIDDLEKRNILYRAEDYSHRYPICWRCDNELVFRLVDEWFISMDALRSEIMDCTRMVERWIPPFGLDRELDWLRNMGDWCISKKRYWGLALPIWECACGHFSVIGSRDELKSRAVEGWSAFEGRSPHRPWVDMVKIRCEECGKTMSRIADVGNPWLDAGIVPFSTIRPPEDMQNLEHGYPQDRSYWQEWFPADFITECFPGQFRNWFYAILTMSTVLEKRPPFRVVLGHALVHDEHGEEMHKSKGNAIWFDDAAEKIGAEVMRWMFARQNPVQNVHFGYGPGTEIKKTMLTLWNVYSFFVTYARIDGFTPSGKVLAEERLTMLDRWILSRLNSLVRSCDRNYDRYDCPGVTREVEAFFEDLSNWYLRRNRRRFWKSENDQDKVTAYLVLYECLTRLILVIAPIAPFLSEEIYQNLARSVNEALPQSVHLCDFPVASEERIDPALEGRVALVQRIVSLGRACRNRANLKVRQPLSAIRIMMPAGVGPLDQADLAIIREELNIKSVAAVGPDALADHYTLQIVPRFDRLGPRLGKDVRRAGEMLKQLDQPAIARFLEQGRATLFMGDRELEVTRGDVEAKAVGIEGWSVVVDNEFGVGVATGINSDLVAEGMVREFIHRVQAMRKEADLNITDRIRISLQGGHPLLEAIELHRQAVMEETLAVQLVEGQDADGFVREVSVNGVAATISIRRVDAR